MSKLIFPLVLFLMGISFSQDFLREAFDDDMDENKCDVDGWRMIFDGTPETVEETMWLSSATHGDGGKWWVARDEDAVDALKIPPGQLVLWSDQNVGGNGGLMYSHRAYENVEVNVSFWPGWNNDGGLFLRSNGQGPAYQVMFDYQNNNTVGGIWPENGLSASNQFLYRLASETSINAIGIEWPAEDWDFIWDPDGYNIVNAAIYGETNIDAWIFDEGHVVTDYSEGSNAAELNETGYIGLQIHAGGGSWQGGPNKYLWLKVRETDDDQNPICIGTRTSACNIEGYINYDAQADIGDPSKCTEIGTAIRGCLDIGHPAYTPGATVHDPSLCVVGIKSYQDNPLAQSIDLSQSPQGLMIIAEFNKSYQIIVRNLSGQILGTFSGKQGLAKHVLSTTNMGLIIVETLTGDERAIQKITMM